MWMCMTQQRVIQWKWVVTSWLNVGTSSRIRRVGRMLIDASQVIPVIEIMNTSDIPVLVRKGYWIGEIVSDFINFGLEISNVIDNEQLTMNKRAMIMKLNLTFWSIMGHWQNTWVSLSMELWATCLLRSRQKTRKRLMQCCVVTSWHSKPIQRSWVAPVPQRYRCIPLHKRPVIEAEVKRMLDQGVIEPAQRPWSSNIVLVWKPQSKKWRVCSDFRWINSLTKKDAYPLPRIDETLEMLEGAACFVSLDLVHGYWEVPIHHDDKEKTAFYTHMGMYQFRVLPIGVCNGGATFKRLMETVLSGLLGERALVYFDDIVVWGRTVGECSVNLDQVLKRLVDAGLKIRGETCQFFKPEMEYLGHIVSKEGVSSSPSKIAAVNEWPIPKNITEVRSFHGFCSTIEVSSKISPRLPILWHSWCIGKCLSTGRMIVRRPWKSFGTLLWRHHYWRTRDRKGRSSSLPTRQRRGWAQFCPKYKTARKGSSPTRAGRSGNRKRITMRLGRN